MKEVVEARMEVVDVIRSRRRWRGQVGGSGGRGGGGGQGGGGD